MPAAALHPDGKSMAAQSQDNQVVAFIAVGDKFKINRKKKFTGHSVSGFPCGVTFSPDGQFLVSGDASGKCFFWDWNKGKLTKLGTQPVGRLLLNRTSQAIKKR
jgi:pre-mRNA-processing factor 17